MTHTTRRNSSTREGGWALWMPLRTHMNRIQDGGLQSGTDRSEAMAGSLHCLSLCSLGPATTAGIPLLPAKKSMGQLGVIRSPPGLNTQDRTGQEQEALLGKAWKLRLLLCMMRSQGPLQDPSATSSPSATRRPLTSLRVYNRQGKLKLFLRARQDLKRHSWP